MDPQRAHMMTAPSLGAVRILFATRTIRLFCYGLVSVILALYLVDAGLGEEQVGFLFTLALAGDAGISLWLTTSADAFGRRRILGLGAILMLVSGLVFMGTTVPGILMAAAVLGVISPNGKEIGPFLSVEQAALSQLIADKQRTHVFAWYNLAGSTAAALGALAGGWSAEFLRGGGMTEHNAYRALLACYALGGAAMLILFRRLPPSVEAISSSAIAPRRILGLGSSRRTVLGLSGLFAIDAFGGGLIVQSMLAYWFHIRFGADVGVIGSIFFGVNVLAGASALGAAWLARRFGLLNTMIFTHMPSNVLLMLIPFMPSLPLAVAILMLRFSISQMDVPTRQSYTMAVVAPEERAAASGVTTIARSAGAAVSPVLTGIFFRDPGLMHVPFLLAGGVKLLYDGLLYFSFRRLKPPEEAETSASAPAT